MAPCLDELRNIDINRMVKLGAIPKCGFKSGNWIWSDRDTGEQNSCVSYTADTMSENKTLRLQYVIVDTQEKVDVTIQLSTSKQPFGGERFWFVCPITGKRVPNETLETIEEESDLRAAAISHGDPYNEIGMVRQRLLHKLLEMKAATQNHSGPFGPHTHQRHLMVRLVCLACRLVDR